MINRYDRPILFYSLATAIPWALWFVAGSISYIEPYSDRNLKIASVIAFLGLLGPLVVAYLLMRKDPELLSDLYSRLFSLKSIKPIYIVFACFVMLGSILLAQAISLLFGYSASQFNISGHFTFTSGIFPVWFMLIIAPILEELGWHSYATDSLRSRMNLLKTSLLFGVYWAIWHIPLGTIRDYYQSNLVETGWIYSVNFLVSVIPFTILINWLYYKTGRNILLTIIFHISAGFFNEIFSTHPDSKIIQTILLLILATILIINDKRFFFEKRSNQTDQHSAQTCL